MGITDFDLDGMNMPVIVGMAGINLNGSMSNLQLGATDVGWNYSDLNLVGGNNPAFGASPEQVLESFVTVSGWRAANTIVGCGQLIVLAFARVGAERARHGAGGRVAAAGATAGLMIGDLTRSHYARVHTGTR